MKATRHVQISDGVFQAQILYTANSHKCRCNSKDLPRSHSSNGMQNMTGTAHMEALTSLEEAFASQSIHYQTHCQSSKGTIKLDQPELAFYNPDPRVPLAIVKATAPWMTMSNMPIKPTQLILESADPISKPPAVKLISTPSKSIANCDKSRQLQNATLEHDANKSIAE